MFNVYKGCRISRAGCLMSIMGYGIYRAGCSMSMRGMGYIGPVTQCL